MATKGTLVFLLQMIVTVASLCVGAEITTLEKDQDLFCKFASNFVPGTKWRAVRPGDQLYVFDALLTCSASTARIKSILSFGNMLFWEHEGSGSKIADIPSETLIVFSTRRETHPAIAVEILEVKGNVYYSTDRELLKKSGIVGVRTDRWKPK